MIIAAVIITLSALVGIVLLCLGVIWLERKFPGKRFDEMQTQARYRSYRLAFIVGFLYYLGTVGILINQVEGEKTIEPYLLMTGGFLLQVMVAHTYCLLTHAALPFSENPVIIILFHGLFGIGQLLSFRTQLARYRSLGMTGPIPFTGQGAMQWFFLALGICFIYLAILHTIQLLRSRKE